MFKTAILSIVSASSLTVGATDSFSAANATALEMANVYTIAGQVSQDIYHSDFSSEARMYQAAARLEPLAQNMRSIGEARMAQEYPGL